MKTLKKAASVLLVLSMIFSMVVTCAFADDTEPSKSAGTDVTEETEQEEVSLPEETEPAAEDTETTETAAEPMEETEPGIRTLADNVIWSGETASSWDELKAIIQDTDNRSSYVEITLTGDITWEETLSDFTTMPMGIRIVGNAADQGTKVTVADTISNGYLFNSSYYGYDVSANHTVEMENLTVDFNGNGLISATNAAVVELTLTNVAIQSGGDPGYGFISLDGTGMTNTKVALNMTGVTTENCTGSLISTVGIYGSTGLYVEANITDCDLSSTADSSSNRSAMIQLTANGASGATEMYSSTISNSKISWSDGEGTDGTVYSFQSGLSVECGQTMALTGGTTLSGPMENTYAINLATNYSGTNYLNPVLDLTGEMSFTATDSGQPTINTTTYGSVVQIGASTPSVELYCASGSVSGSGCATFEISSGLTSDILFDFSTSVSSYEPTIATAAEGYDISDTDLGHMKYAGETDVLMKTVLEDNEIRFVNTDTAEIEVGDAETFKTVCESTAYSGVNTVIIKLTDDIIMNGTSTTDGVVTSIGATKLVIDGGEQYSISLNAGDAEKGSLTMFAVSMSSKSLTFQDVNINAGGQQFISTTSMTGALTLENMEITGLYGTGISVTMTSTAGSVTMDNVKCESCSGTFFSGGNYSTVDVIASNLSVTALKDGDSVLYMTGTANASSSLLTVQESKIALDDNSYSAYGVYTSGRCGLTLDNAEVTISGSGADTYAVNYYNYYNETYQNGTYPYKLTINSSTFSRGDDSTDPAVIRLDCSQTSASNKASYSPILHTDGAIYGQPVIYMTEYTYIATSGALQDKVYFDYPDGAGASNPTLAIGESGENDDEAYELKQADADKLICTDESSPRTVKLDTESNSILFCRGDQTAEIHVKDADELSLALTSSKYLDYAQEIIYLDADIQMTSVVASGKVAHDNVVIDGSPETLESGEANSDTFTLTAPADLTAGRSFMFTLAQNSGSFTFRNMAIDGGQVKLISSGSGNSIKLENVELQNFQSQSNTNSAIFQISGGTSADTSLTMTQVRTSEEKPNSGMLIYMNGARISAMLDKCTLELNIIEDVSASVSDTVNRMINTAAANANYRGTLTISGGSLCYNDTYATSGYGLYINNYWDVTVKDGAILGGTRNNLDTKTVYVYNTSNVLNLENCSFVGTGGGDPIVYLNGSGRQVHTSGETQGMQVFMPVITDTDPDTTPILISDDLQYDIKVNFTDTSSVPGTDPVLATGENGHTVNDADAEYMFYVDETSARMARVETVETGDDAESYIVLYRADMEDCDITLLNAAGYEDDIPYYWANKNNRTIEPEVEVRGANGNVVLNSYYTVEYADNVLPEDAEVGYEQDAMVTVTPVEGDELTGGAITLPFKMVVPETTDISDPNNNCEIVISYNYSSGSISVTLTKNGVELTEGVDFTVEYTIDTDRYTMNITVTGIGLYEGTLVEMIKLTGYDSHVFEVIDEPTLNQALSERFDTIVFADDITASNNIEIRYPVTIIGDGHSLDRDLNVNDGAELFVRDVKVNGGLTVYAGGMAEVTEGSSIKAVYVEENGEATIGDCSVSNGTIENYGTLNVEEKATFSDLINLRRSEVASYNYAMISNFGILNWSGQYDASDASWTNIESSQYYTEIIYNAGTMNMNGGEINGYSDEDEHLEIFYGAVLNYGTLNMSGGTITGFNATGTIASSGNAVPGGGGVRNNGEFNMNGGRITGNMAENHSNGDNVSENTQPGCGGGVYNGYDAVFTMSGGEISENIAGIGGGVFNLGPNTNDENSVGGIFTMTGGTICDNMLFGDEIEVGNDTFNMSMGGENQGVELFNVGSNILACGGTTNAISGGTVSGDDLVLATLTDMDGNEQKAEIHTGIALDVAYSFRNGVNASNTQYAGNNDCSMTVTGDPDIEVGIMLINNETWFQNARLNNSNDFNYGDADPNNWDDYDVTYEGDPLYSEFWSWLWLDGDLSAEVTVDTLDLLSYTMHWTNSSNTWTVHDLRSTTLSQNNDRDIYAFYLDGVEPAESDGDLLNLSDGQTLRQLYFYELRENEATEQGMGSSTTVTTEKLFDYESWQLCTHSVLEDIEEVPEVAATCEEYGTAGHFECTYCGAMFTDLECTHEVTIDDLLLDPLNHKYSDGTSAIGWTDGEAATCTEDGYKEGYICELCGKFFNANGTEDTSGNRIIDALGHDWIVVDEIPATETTDGQSAYCECERCGERMTEPEVIPATGVEADKTALESAIEGALALLDDPDSPYTEDSLATLQAAVDAATEADEKDDISQTEVNNALADLLDAVMDLENEDSDTPDATALEIAIDSAEALLEDEDSPYTDESLDDLADVVEAATNDVLDNPNATQEDIDAAVDAIMAAIKDMEKTPLPNTDALEALIGEVEAVMDQLDPSDYTEDSWQALEDALDSAKDVAADPASQDAVDEALAALADALESLDPLADKSALETLIDKATELVNTTGEYTDETLDALKDELAKAEAVLSKEITADDQDEVDAAADALLQAIMDLEKFEPINTAALDAAIAAVDKLNKDNYTSDSWSDLQDALAKAKAVQADPESQDAVDEAAVALMDAIGNLVKVADTSTLDALIARVDDLKETDYTQESWAILETALQAAEAIDPATASQTEVDTAASNLLDAIIGLEKAETPVDKTGLEVMIEQVREQYKEEDESKYDPDNWRALQDALTAAEGVWKDDEATQDQVSEVLQELLDAVMNMTETDDTGEAEPNTSGLEIVIDSAQALLDEQDSSPYTQDSLNNLQDAVDAANELLKTGTYTADEVNEAAAAIKDAINKLEVNTEATQSEKNALESAITAAKKLAESSEYTSETVKALEDAITEANRVLSSDNPTKDQVNDALEALTQAVNKLVVNTNPTASEADKADLETVINAAENLNSSNYTSDSWSAMQEALTAAMDLLSDSSATKSQVNEAMMTLTLAISSLVPTGNSGTSTVKDGFVQEDGEWHYYDNGTRFTGDDIKEDLKKAIDGTDGWYYIVSGKVDFSYTGVSHFANAYGWWYIKGGKVDFSCNSVEQNQYGWWYVIGGKVDFSYTGVSNYSNTYGWWYIEKGKVNFSKTSIEPNNYGWWRVVDGKVDFSCNSVEQNDYGWWYVVGGKVDFSYTGVSNYSNAYGWWYISKGKVDFSCNSVEQNQYGWWYVLGGKVDFSYTGVANYANAYGWWYISKGKVDFSYTGTASNNYGTWNVVNGKVVF